MLNICCQIIFLVYFGQPWRSKDICPLNPDLKIATRFVIATFKLLVIWYRIPLTDQQNLPLTDLTPPWNVQMYSIFLLDKSCVWQDLYTWLSCTVDCGYSSQVQPSWKHFERWIWLGLWQRRLLTSKIHIKCPNLEIQTFCLDWFKQVWEFNLKLYQNVYLELLIGWNSALNKITD